jgi:hypothetical protein
LCIREICLHIYTFDAEKLATFVPQMPKLLIESPPIQFGERNSLDMKLMAPHSALEPRIKILQ